MNRRRVLKNRRSEGTREISRKFLILVEGRSEENYLNRFKKRNSPLKIMPIIANRQDPCSIADLCIRRSKEYDISNERGDKAAIVYDVDQNTSVQISECSKKCVESNIDMYLSSPSFECWLIMHFRDVNSNDTQDVLLQSMTNELGQEYKKSKNINRLINDSMIKDAIERSSKRIPDFKNRNEECLKKYPNSTLHFLVQELLVLD
ncbi:MAG TPA: RloB family protein [Candidatus Methanomethylophilaceae archaeon]|nr:RloB family protein [Candidatus Methanomethylophilaceae archaeon]